MADVAKERSEQAKGPAAQAHELDELTKIYEDRGVSLLLARQVRYFCCAFIDAFIFWLIDIS